MSEYKSRLRPPRWLKPMNKVMVVVQRFGVPTGPAMELTVPGRKSGVPRSTPMTPFDHDGELYTSRNAAASSSTARPTNSKPWRAV